MSPGERPAEALGAEGGVAAALPGGVPRAAPPSERTSVVLRAILADNPGVKTFSVGQILASIGSHRVETALMVCSMPGIVPVPTDRGMVPLSTGALACQLVAGRRRLRLPRFILRKGVPRRALAVAIHTVLPLLEAAERAVRPRWSWVHHPNGRRAVGVLIFLSALAIAEPLLGYNVLHAVAIFVMSLGMAERDGLAVLIGAAVGIASLIMVAASGVSARIARSRALAWFRKVARNLGRRALAAVLERRGYKALARVASLRLHDLLMFWNPERAAAPIPRREGPDGRARRVRQTGKTTTAEGALRSVGARTPRAA